MLDLPPLCAALLLAGCQGPSVPPEPDVTTSAMEPAYCEVAGRLHEAGYLPRDFAAVDAAGFRAALTEFARDLGLEPPEALMVAGDDPVWHHLSKLVVRHSTLVACEAAGGGVAPTSGLGVAAGGEVSPAKDKATAEKSPAPPSTVEDAPPKPAVGATGPVPMPPSDIADEEEVEERKTPPVDLALGKAAFVIESIKCEGRYGAWLLLFSGDVTGLDGDAATVATKRRYGLRYWPEAEGVDATDWYCVPRRRFCFSEVAFSDWRGEVRLGEPVTRRREWVVPAHAGLPEAVEPTIVYECSY